MLNGHGVRRCGLHSSVIGQGSVAGFEILGSILSVEFRAFCSKVLFRGFGKAIATESMENEQKKKRKRMVKMLVCLTLSSTVVTVFTTSLTFTNSTFCPHICIYVFCVDLRTNSDYFPIQH